MAFLGTVCLRRAGQAAEAESLLAEVSPEIAPGSWQASVMDFMRGSITQDSFLAKAKGIEERTEAHAYVGLMAAVDERREEAITHLRWVKERGTKTYVEYEMACAELKRLDGESPDGAPAKRPQ